MLPQFILILFLVVYLVISVIEDGKSVTVSSPRTFVRVIVLTALLHWGGFFDEFMRILNN